MCDLSWFIFCFEFEWTSPVSLCIIVSCEFLCINYLVVTSRCFIRFYRNKYWDRFPPLATSFVGFFITHIHIHSNSFSSLSPGICWYLWVLILRQIFILRWWLLYTLANPFQRFCEKLAGNDEKCSYNTREVHIRLRQGWGTQGLEGRCYPK